MSKLRKVLIAGVTFSSIAMSSTGLINANAETIAESANSRVNTVTENAPDMGKWAEGLKLNDVCPANVTIYIPPSGASTDFSNPFIPSLGGVHQQLTMNDYPNNVTVSLPYNALWTTGLMTYNESRDSGIRLSLIHIS